METVLSQSPFLSNWQSELPLALGAQNLKGSLDVLLSPSSTSVHHHLCQFHLLAASVHLQGSPQCAMLFSLISHVCPHVSGRNARLPLQVFQRRNTGQLDFFKRWRTYVEGFGDPMKEFWLGMIFEHP